MPEPVALRWALWDRCLMSTALYSRKGALTAGQGHPSARVVEEHTIFESLPGYVLGGYPVSDPLDCFVRAGKMRLHFLSLDLLPKNLQVSLFLRRDLYKPIPL